MEAAPATSLEVVLPKLIFEFLMVARSMRQRSLATRITSPRETVAGSVENQCLGPADGSPATRAPDESAGLIPRRSPGLAGGFRSSLGHVEGARSREAVDSG
jgi:hypothetical protein